MYYSYLGTCKTSYVYILQELIPGSNLIMVPTYWPSMKKNKNKIHQSQRASQKDSIFKLMEVMQSAGSHA